jgi:cytochrome P450
MPFRSDPHFGLGQHLVTVEIAIIAAAIIQRYALSLEEGATLPKAAVDLTLKPKTPLLVRFARRCA